MLNFRVIRPIALGALIIGALAACDHGPVWFDYVHDDGVKLTLEYKGHNFYDDGIGQVRLKYCIDGDTAHFIDSTVGGEPIKARFYGIDTPESTGKVQPFGHAASEFTKGVLKAADADGTIVVSTPREGYGKPQFDSTGERYISLIWVNEEKKDAPISELYLLNLWIVQEGLSWVKNVDEIPEFMDTFYAAEAQAKAFKKGMNSGEPDPDFPSSEYEPVTLLDLANDNLSLLRDPTYESIYNNTRVTFTGTVAGFSNRILYLEDYFDKEESGIEGGTYAGVNIFVGMDPVATKYTTANTYLQMFGLCQVTENFGFQITDVQGHLPFGKPFYNNDVKILATPEENSGEHKLHTFEYTPAALSARVESKNYESLNCAVEVTEPVEVSKAFIQSNQEITLFFKDVQFGAYITFVYKGDPDHPRKVFSEEEDFMGKKFLIKGVYTYHKTAAGKIMYQINPSRQEDVILVKDEA